MGKALCSLLLCGIPGSVHRDALQDPEKGQDHIRHDEKNDKTLDWPDDALAGGYTEKQKADRDFSGHQRKKCLDPITIAEFLELLNLMVAEVVLMPSVAIMNAHTI